MKVKLPKNELTSIKQYFYSYGFAKFIGDLEANRIYEVDADDIELLSKSDEIIFFPNHSGVSFRNRHFVLSSDTYKAEKVFEVDENYFGSIADSEQCVISEIEQKIKEDIGF